MKKFVKKPLIVLAVGVVMLMGTSVGATRAALIYQDDAKTVDFRTSRIEVELLEGETTDEMKSISNGGSLTFPGIPKDPKDIKIGKKYDEAICVANTSEAYNEYVRVKVRKYWGKKVQTEDTTRSNAESTIVIAKDTTLDPALIELEVGDGWIKNPDEHTMEQDVYYYTLPVKHLSEEEEVDNVVPFIKSVTINDKVTRVVNTEPVLNGTQITGTIVNSYAYDNTMFYVELEVDAVQSHNAVNAIYGAWGVKVKCENDAIDDGKIIEIIKMKSEE